MIIELNSAFFQHLPQVICGRVIQKVVSFFWRNFCSITHTMSTTIPIPNFPKPIAQITLLHETQNDINFKDFGSPTKGMPPANESPKFQLFDTQDSKIEKDVIKDKLSNLIAPIHPFFFHDLNVKIAISNPELKSKVQTILQRLGSKIIQSSSQIPDAIIIEETPSDARLKTQQMEKRISHRYTGYSRVTKMPKLISYEQLPGLSFDSTPPVTSNDNPQVEVSLTPSMHNKEFIEILDLHGKYRPISGYVKQTQLDFTETPKCYFFSPFTKVPDDPEEYVEQVNQERKKKMEKINQLNENEINIINEKSKKGYCAICNKNFVNAAEHRCSHSHVSNSNSPVIFQTLDNLSKTINFL